MRRKRSFDRDPHSIRAARQFAYEALVHEPDAVLEVVALLVSELATNSVRHAGTGFHLLIERTSEGIRVEVTDRAGGTPTMRSPGPDEPGGRGLRIVDMLSDSWGVDRGAGPGKTVWFTVASSSVAPASTG